MIDKLWHYVDAEQQKIGPVPAGVIRDAYQSGKLGPNSPVWHAELPQWQALAMHASALGINLNRTVVPTLNGREVKYANFFHRWAALMIDQWLLSLTAIGIVGILALIVYSVSGFSFQEDSESSVIFLSLTILVYLPVYLGLSGSYHIYFETSANHGSLGKQFLGIEVSTDEGEALDKSRAALRWFSAALSHLSQNIGFLIAAFTEKRQALHDFLARTIVLEREDNSLKTPIDRNKRAAIVLVLGVLIMPIVIFASILFPAIHFIELQEQAETAKNRKLATLVMPIQQVIQNRAALDSTCLSQDDAEIKPLMQPLIPLTSDIYIGISDDESACEIFLTRDDYKITQYRFTGDDGWSCEATHKPQDFGDSCQLSD